MLLLLALSTALYFAILKIFLWVLKVDTAYISTFFRPGELLSSPLGVLRGTAAQAIGVYLGLQRVYGVNAYLLVLPLVFGGIGCYAAAKNATWPLRLAIAVTTLGILVTPFAMNLISGGWLPIRALIAVPIAVWLICMIGFAYAPKRIGLGALLIAPLVYFQILGISSQFNANRALVRTHDQILAGAIYERIAHVVPEFSAAKMYKIDFYGAKPFAAPFLRARTSTGGYSFFEWYRGEPPRILAYMKLIGFSNLFLPTVEDRSRLAPVFETMPVWPAEGSVRFFDDVIMVRLGTEPSYDYLNPKASPASAQ